MFLLSSIIQLVHSIYPTICCSDKDCIKVPCIELIKQSDGTVKYLDMIFSSDMIQKPLDYACHVCFTADLVPRCIFFALPGIS